jgi:DNA-binding CsgD family transcriptional regulator
MAARWPVARTAELRRLIAEGKDDKAIGVALGISARAVNGKRYRLDLVRNRSDPYVAAIARAEREKQRALGQ